GNLLALVGAFAHVLDLEGVVADLLDGGGLYRLAVLRVGELVGVVGLDGHLGFVAVGELELQALDVVRRTVEGEVEAVLAVSVLDLVAGVVVGRDDLGVGEVVGDEQVDARVVGGGSGPAGCPRMPPLRGPCPRPGWR
ncbi:MAG: hypothetical protein ACLT98_10785, partial [Eggerthellaceae bacterium]